MQFSSTSNYRTLLSELFTRLQKPFTRYVEDYQYIHIESVNEAVVQLLGTVMDLDLDTVLAVESNSSQIEVFHVHRL